MIAGVNATHIDAIDRRRHEMTSAHMLTDEQFRRLDRQPQQQMYPCYFRTAGNESVCRKKV